MLEAPVIPVENPRDVAAPAEPRRLLIATINRPEGDTGVHTHTRMLHDGLIRAGADCAVVSPFAGSKKWYPIFAVRPLLLHRLNRTWSTGWHRRWHGAALRENLLRRVAAEDVDAVIAQCPVSARAALDVRERLSRRFTVAMVCHFNSSEAQEYRDKGELNDEISFRAMMKFEDRVLAEVDRVVYVSNWARRSVENARGITPRASSVIWNGLEPSRGGGSTEAAEGAGAAGASPICRADLGLAPSDLVLINVGTLERRKNQLGLLDLFVRIYAEHAHAKLVLVGEGEQRTAIERRIAALGLQDAVRLLGMRRDVPALLEMADLYLHYATLENCPIVLLEAARAGLPFAAIAAGGIAELQTRLECEVVLDPSDERKSLAALDPLLKDADVRKERSRRARANFQKYFTQQAMTRAYLNVLREKL
jgi:glycosyltransferase involved in cell wall biosynthesis